MNDKDIKIIMKNNKIIYPKVPYENNLVGYWDFNLQTNTDVNRTTVPDLSGTNNDATLHNFGFNETDYSTETNRMSVSKVGEIDGKILYKKRMKPYGTHAYGGAYRELGRSTLNKGTYSAKIKYKYTGDADFHKPMLLLYNITKQATIVSDEDFVGKSGEDENGFKELKVHHMQTEDSTDTVAVFVYCARTTTDWSETGIRLDTYFYIDYLKIGNIAVRSGFFD